MDVINWYFCVLAFVLEPCYTRVIGSEVLPNKEQGKNQMPSEKDVILEVVKNLEKENFSTRFSNIIANSPLSRHETIVTVQELWNEGTLELYDGSFHTPIVND